MVILGLIIVLVSVIGGFMMGHGNPVLLIQPSEFVIIGGAAAGSLIVMSSKTVIMDIFKSLPKLLKGHSFGKAEYLDLLKTFYDLFVLAQKEGIITIERHVEEPKTSEILSKNKLLMHNEFIQDFFCDTMKMALGGLTVYDIEQLMDADIEVLEEERMQAPGKLQTVAEAFPGLGIVAAVLGIILTMKSIDQGAEAVGEHVAAALVGTFLGILLCYGFVGPMATKMEHMVEEEIRYLRIIKCLVVAYIKGNAPMVSVEMARRTIFTEFRPSFKELEKFIRGK